MMGLIMAGVVIILTLVWTILVFMANGMSDAPSMNDMSAFPGIIIGLTIAAILVAVHYLGV